MAKPSIVPALWSLPEALRARLSPTTYGRQRAIVEDGHLLLVLHQPPGPDDATREGVLLWRKPEGEWLASKGGAGPVALRKLIQSYADIEARLSEGYDRAETTTDLFAILEAVTPLVRAGRNLYQALQTAREAIEGDPLLLEARDSAYEAERNLELLLEDVRNALQYRTAREAEAQAKLAREELLASRRLNVLAALFLPLTAITSVFGMNLRNGVDGSGPGLFWVVVLLAVGLGGAMVAWVLGLTDGKSGPRA